MSSPSESILRNSGSAPRSVTVGFTVETERETLTKTPRSRQASIQAQTDDGAGSSTGTVPSVSALSAQIGGNASASKAHPGASQNAGRRSQKEMTKAERRELQERQRAEKEAAKLAGGGAASKKGAPKQPGNAAKAGFSAHHAQSNVPDIKQQSPTANTLRVATSLRLDDPKKRLKVQKQQSVDRQLAQKPVGLFSHLPQYEKHDNMQARLKKQENIHALVLSLGLKYQNFTIAGGNARCLAMLEAFKKVIADYSTPPGNSLPRHLPSVISKQVDLLSNTRTLAASMKTAIRELKKEISVIPVDATDENAKERLFQFIDTFQKERIETAGAYIAHEAVDTDKIQDGDVILTYGRSSTVLNTLLYAHMYGRNFKVIVADGRPKLEGKEMLKSLVKAGINCGYATCTAVPMLMPEVSKVIIGASAVLANGAILSRVGTAVVCNAAKERQVPVIVLCESYKFLDETRLDSFTWNEIGNPNELADNSNRAPSDYPLHSSILDSSKAGENNSTLATWRSIDPLKLLNLHYDVTPAHFITALLCEHGLVPSTVALNVTRFAAER